MSNHEEWAHRRWTAAFAGYGTGAIIIGFGSQSLLRYADPERLWLGSFLLAASIILFYEGTLREGRWARAIFGVSGGVLMAGACIFVGPLIDASISHSRANDQRCRIIEGEMMRGSPRRDDLPDLFQAFNCRPQTTLMPKRPVQP